MKLIKIIWLQGIIELKSGLHIGSGSDEIKIGGTDQPVIKNPIDGMPYIPGSSLKGKIRSLIEWKEGKVGTDGGPYSTDDSANAIARIFGNGKNKESYKGGPTRVTFNDCYLNSKYIEDWAIKENMDKLFEIKTEVSIDRVKGTASGAGPRRMERIVSGAEFDFSLAYKIFAMDTNGGDDGKLDEENFNLLLKGMRMLELDSLGGSGSRGYGKIEFKYLKKDKTEEIDLKKININ
ncbi:MAG: type III-A CRISPR-associated RAMP protein Csm3 [bacterium]